MSSSVARQCRHLRNADDRFLYPPSILLAGLSADTNVNVPLIFRSCPSITNRTPLSCQFEYNYVTDYSYYSLTDSSLITLSVKGCMMVFMPYLFIKRDSTTASNSMDFNLDRSSGLMLPRVK